MKSLFKDLELFDMEEVNGGKKVKTIYGDSVASTELSLIINDKNLMNMDKNEAIKMINDCNLIKDNKCVIPKDSLLIDSKQYGGCMEYILKCGNNTIQTGLDIKMEDYFK